MSQSKEEQFMKQFLVLWATLKFGTSGAEKAVIYVFQLNIFSILMNFSVHRKTISFTWFIFEKDKFFHKNITVYVQSTEYTCELLWSTFPSPQSTL